MERQITLLFMYTYSCTQHVCLEASSQLMKKKQTPLNFQNVCKMRENCMCQMFPGMMFICTCFHAINSDISMSSVALNLF